MTEEARISDDLIDRILLMQTLNSTLVHFLLSTQVDGTVDPDRVDSLTQGLLRTRRWMEEATTMKGVNPSTQNIISLIVKRLSQIESLLPKLSAKAKEAEARGTPAQEILTLLDGDSKVSTSKPPSMRTAPENAAADSKVIPLVGEEAEVVVEPYRKVEVENDEWGLIGQMQRMITQYSKRCHVLLPTFWVDALRELHRYRSDSAYYGDVVEIPGRVLATIVKGLLTEAPGARLLQDLSKKRPQENHLNSSEMERVERAVSVYFSGVSNVLTGKELKVEDKLNEARNSFDAFGWGGPELEKRIIKRINQQCEEALQNAESASDPQRQVIYSEITKLLTKLQHAILAEPRLREILAQMKP
ncbi:MAG: hypothetical protein AM324_002775 [Candidatus Thorarchaeota archaeon SMTZ1-83]|nr:MAG: hypothetical protein AM324_03795 [Candidatus Thorarchaeota archaeon SMTZ1-83]